MKTYLVYSKTMTTALPLVCNDETVKRWEGHTGMNIVEMVPASEVREREELIQRLAEDTHNSVWADNSMQGKKDAKEDADLWMRAQFGLRKIDGKWKVCK